MKYYKSARGIKKVRNHTEPLQPPTLAAFLPWGSSEGAGRMALTDRKSTMKFRNAKYMVRLL